MNYKPLGLTQPPAQNFAFGPRRRTNFDELFDSLFTDNETARLRNYLPKPPTAAPTTPTAAPTALPSLSFQNETNRLGNYPAPPAAPSLPQTPAAPSLPQTPAEVAAAYKSTDQLEREALAQHGLKGFTPFQNAVLSGDTTQTKDGGTRYFDTATNRYSTRYNPDQSPAAAMQRMYDSAMANATVNGAGDVTGAAIKAVAYGNPQKMAEGFRLREQG